VRPPGRMRRPAKLGLVEYDINIFCTQFPIVKGFLYHLTCYRELERAYRELELSSEFWTYTIDAHLLQACILWCMVFGSTGPNPTHWKNLCKDERKNLENSFRKGLFEGTELTKEKWERYWEDMKHFRDTYAAHRQGHYSEPVPEFDTAQAVAYYYDGWIRRLIDPDQLTEPPLKESALLMQKRIRPLVMLYLSGTRLISEGTEDPL